MSGRGLPARLGAIPRARIRRSPNGPIIRWCASPTRTRTPTPDGRGLELPGEGEWEVAARGGLTGAAYTWGEESERPGQRLANFWHGDFPWRPEPGYGRTSPVGSFEPNGYGLFDMAG